MENPFEIISAELMQPQQVADEFVQDHTEQTKLASHAHTVVFGSRGSGKSMHFRFLEPDVQARRRDKHYDGVVERFLAEKNAFVGVYINCREGVLNSAELKRISDFPESAFVDTLLDRYLSCAILKAVMSTLQKQIPFATEHHVVIDQVPSWCARALSGQDVVTIANLFDQLRPRVNLWLDQLGDLVEECLLSPSKLPTDHVCILDSPHLTSHLLEFLRYLKTTAKLDVPFFLLFDEANELCSGHQRGVNSLIAQRSQASVCIKVATQRHGFVVGMGVLRTTIDETHDYTVLDLDGLYTNNKGAYYKRLESIANERLARAGAVVKISEYLPPHEKGENLLEAASRIAEQRYYAIEDRLRPADLQNFIKKYAPAIVFQELDSPKASNIYAGFDNVVHLSSGIVRSFIDCCSKMYTKCRENDPHAEPLYIPVRIQADVIKDYSDSFVQAQLVGRMRSLKNDAPERQVYKQLHSLLNGLGLLFRKRLMDKKSREPRIISVSLKDEPSDDLQRVLDLAEREAFLHVSWYRSKRGHRNLRCYILNRRLCPHYNLDLSGFQGRLELSSEELQIALDDDESFVHEVLARGLDEPETSVAQLPLFEW